jgi:hypothetical protein
MWGLPLEIRKNWAHILRLNTNRPNEHWFDYPKWPEFLARARPLKFWLLWPQGFEAGVWNKTGVVGKVAKEGVNMQFKKMVTHILIRLNAYLEKVTDWIKLLEDQSRVTVWMRIIINCWASTYRLGILACHLLSILQQTRPKTQPKNLRCSQECYFQTGLDVLRSRCSPYIEFRAV